MKPTYQIIPLSGSGNYTPVNITNTTPATAAIIHTASATDYDELWLEVFNHSAEDAAISLAIGGVNPHQIITQFVPAGVGLIPLLRGTKMSSSTIVRAYASTTNKLSIVGYAHRIVFI